MFSVPRPLRGPLGSAQHFSSCDVLAGEHRNKKKLESKHGKRKLGRQKLVTTSFYAMAEVIFHVSPPSDNFQ